MNALPELLVVTARPRALLPRLRAAGVAGQVTALEGALAPAAQPVLLDTVERAVPDLLALLVALPRQGRAGAALPPIFALLDGQDHRARQLAAWCAPILLHIGDTPTLPPLGPWVRLPWRPLGPGAVYLDLVPPVADVLPPTLARHALAVLHALPRGRTYAGVARRAGVAPATLGRVLAALRQALGVDAGRVQYFHPPALAQVLLDRLAGSDAPAGPPTAR